MDEIGCCRRLLKIADDFNPRGSAIIQQIARRGLGRVGQRLDEMRASEDADAKQ